MRKADLTKEQREELERQKELVDWLQGGFHTYADLCGQRGQEWAAMRESHALQMRKVYNYTPAQLAKMFYRGEIHENIRVQIELYAESFDRILRGKVTMPDTEDLHAVRSDLCKLMKSGCPAVATVELMLACTSDFGVTMPEVLSIAQPLSYYLRSIAEDPSYFRFRRRARRFKNAVPPSIQFVLEANTMCSGPYRTPRESKNPAARVAFHLAYFYTFLKHFGCTHETMTFVLRAMQYARRHVRAVADYLTTNNIEAFRAEKRVNRFFASHPASKREIRTEIHEYMCGPRIKKRGTLLGIY
jgi:hypothetical protein